MMDDSRNLTIYTCQPDLTSMLTCIHTAWSSRKGFQNIRLVLEPVEQYELFHEYIHVDGDPVKAESVADAVCRKISPEFFRELALASYGYEADRLDLIYHVMILGFARGEEAIEMVQYRDVTRLREILVRISREVQHFRQFIRFHRVGNAYIAHIEPKSRVLVSIAPHFEDRMPSEHWILIDDVHGEAVVHPKDGHFYMQQLTEAEMVRLAETESVNDDYTELWKAFFDSIAIKERTNASCQQNFYPLWLRKHAVEFTDKYYGFSNRA